MGVQQQLPKAAGSERPFEERGRRARHSVLVVDDENGVRDLMAGGSNPEGIR